MGLKMELNPLEAYIPIGSTVRFVCKYEYPEQLNILIFENEVLRNVDMYLKYNETGEKHWRTNVGSSTITVKCVLKNNKMMTVGMLTAKLHPGLESFINNKCLIDGDGLFFMSIFCLSHH